MRLIITIELNAFTKKIMLKLCQIYAFLSLGCKLCDVSIYPTPQQQVGCDTRSAGLNSEFFSFSADCLTKIEEISSLNYLPIAGGEKMDSYLFQRY